MYREWVPFLYGRNYNFAWQRQALPLLYTIASILRIVVAGLAPAMFATPSQ